MPRRREVPKREILPDPKFGNVELSKFMNVIMEGGKKAVAERIIYGALELIEKKHPDKDPVGSFHCCYQQREAHGGSEVPSRRWCQLPGAG
jgi:small subunit ribosomal protein S7